MVTCEPCPVSSGSSSSRHLAPAGPIPCTFPGLCSARPPAPALCTPHSCPDPGQAQVPGGCRRWRPGPRAPPITCLPTFSGDTWAHLPSLPPPLLQAGPLRTPPARPHLPAPLHPFPLSSRFSSQPRAVASSCLSQTLSSRGPQKFWGSPGSFLDLRGCRVPCGSPGLVHDGDLPCGWVVGWVLGPVWPEWGWDA